MRKQIVVLDKKKYIDKNAQEYILVERYMEYSEIYKEIKGKIKYIDNPYKKRDYYKESEYIISLAERIIHDYGEAIDNYFGVDLNESQWNIIMCSWLKFALFDLYYRYLKLSTVRKFDVYLLGVSNYHYEKGEAEYFASCLFSNVKSAFLWSCVAKYMGISIKKEYICEGNKRNRYLDLLIRGARDPQKVKRYLIDYCLNKEQKQNEKKRAFNYSAKVYSTGHPHVITEESFFESLDEEVSIIDMEKISNQSGDILSSLERKIELRKKVLFDSFHPKCEFEAIAHNILIERMPVAYFEGALEYYELAKTITQYMCPKKIYLGPNTGVELMNYVVAILKRKGTIVCDVQHSMSYGICLTNFASEAMYSDYILCWGGIPYESVYQRAELRKVCCSRPRELLLKKQHKKEKILLVCDRVLYCESGVSCYFANKVKEQIEFVKNLSYDYRKNLYIRVDYNCDYNRFFAKWTKKHFPEVTIETRDSKTIIDSVMESNFIVCDYYSSAIMEALLIDKSVCFFLSTEILAINPILKKYLLEMENLGLFRYKGKELADVISEKDDYMRWLSSKAVKEFYKRFVEEFAGVTNREDIYSKWRNEILGLEGEDV